MTTISKVKTTGHFSGRWHLDTRDGDILAGVVVTAFATVIFFQVSTLPKGAASFPRGIAVVLALSGLLLIMRSFRMPRTGKIVAHGYSWNLFAIAVLLWCATVWLIRPLDLFIVAPVFMAILSWIMGGTPRALVGVLRAVAFGIAASVGIWGIFVLVLGVSLP